MSSFKISWRFLRSQARRCNTAMDGIFFLSVLRSSVLYNNTLPVPTHTRSQTHRIPHHCRLLIIYPLHSFVHVRYLRSYTLHEALLDTICCTHPILHSESDRLLLTLISVLIR